MKKSLLLSILFFSVLTSSKTQQNNSWYFGHIAGLNFSPPAGQPVPQVINEWFGKLNGVAQSSGIYVWSFEAMDEKTNTELIRKGTVILIRQDRIIIKNEIGLL